VRCYLVRITKSEMLTEDSSPSLMTPFHVQLYLKGSIIKMVSRHSKTFIQMPSNRRRSKPPQTLRFQRRVVEYYSMFVTQPQRQRPLPSLGLRSVQPNGVTALNICDMRKPQNKSRLGWRYGGDEENPFASWLTLNSRSFKFPFWVVRLKHNWVHVLECVKWPASVKV
jgi:hypothetical protein